MKRVTITFILTILCTCVVKAQTGAYSPVHLQHLKNCSPYSEVYETQIDSNDPFSPNLNLRSTETILGWLNGKCRVKSTIYSTEAQQDIMEIKCAYSKDKLASIIKKMKNINSGNSDEIQNLNKELQTYINDPSVCTIKTLVNED